jgi:hypothetical protein
VSGRHVPGKTTLGLRPYLAQTRLDISDPPISNDSPQHAGSTHTDYSMLHFPNPPGSDYPQRSTDATTRSVRQRTHR